MKDLHPNIQMLEIVAGGLGPLLEKVYFVGGATTSLYLDAPTTSIIRPTDDVDCVVEISSYEEDRKLNEQLEKRGFKHFIEHGAPICRWLYQGIKVDVMPSDPKVLGFNNRWYKLGIQFSEDRALPSGRTIHLFSIPCFLASKLEAFHDRGKDDFYGSKDLEDIVTVLFGRSTIRSEILQAPPDMRNYFKEEFSRLTENETFVQSLSGHLAFLSSPEDGARQVLDILKNI